MMKNVLKILTISLFVLISTISAASGAKLDNSAPYSGEYLFLYNRGEQSVVFESLPGSEIAEKSCGEVSGIPENTVAIEETENGNLYRVEAVFEEEEIQPFVSLFSLDDSYRTFSAIDIYDNSRYQFYANKVYEDDNCKIYVEENQLSEAAESALGESMSAEFAKVITHIKANFADYSGQTVLLIHDIRDPYYHKVSNAYTGGYFYSGDYNSGERILHIDLFPLMAANNQSPLNVSKSYSTIAHEFTHLVEYTVNGTNKAVDENWFSELFALSSEAAIYPDESDSARFQYFWQDYEEVIKNGAVLNYSDYTDNNNDISANYGLLYIFGRYLKTRFGEDIFKSVLTASEDAMGAEEALISGIKNKGAEITFEELVRDFYIALVLNEGEGEYKLLESSYSDFINLPMNLSKNINLRPGAAIVVPLYNEEFDTENLSEDIMFTVFSSENETEIENLKTEYEKVKLRKDVIMPLFNLSANGKQLYGSELMKKVIFIGDKNSVLFRKNGSFYSKKTGEIRVRCQSVADKNVYTDFSIVTDSDSVHVNFHSHPVFDSEKNAIVLTTFFTDTEYKAGKLYNIYAAVYDEDGCLVCCTEKTPEFGRPDVVYARGLISDKIKKDEKYSVKLFVFDSDGKLSPQAESFTAFYN